MKRFVAVGDMTLGGVDYWCGVLSDPILTTTGVLTATQVIRFAGITAATRSARWKTCRWLAGRRPFTLAHSSVLPNGFHVLNRELVVTSASAIRILWRDPEFPVIQ